MAEARLWGPARGTRLRAHPAVVVVVERLQVLLDDAVLHRDEEVTSSTVSSLHLLNKMLHANIWKGRKERYQARSQLGDCTGSQISLQPASQTHFQHPPSIQSLPRERDRSQAESTSQGQVSRMLVAPVSAWPHTTTMSSAGCSCISTEGMKKSLFSPLIIQPALSELGNNLKGLTVHLTIQGFTFQQHQLASVYSQPSIFFFFFL